MPSPSHRRSTGAHAASSYPGIPRTGTKARPMPGSVIPKIALKRSVLRTLCAVQVAADHDIRSRDAARAKRTPPNEKVPSHGLRGTCRNCQRWILAESVSAQYSASMRSTRPFPSSSTILATKKNGAPAHWGIGTYRATKQRPRMSASQRLPAFEGLARIGTIGQKQSRNVRAKFDQKRLFGSLLISALQ